MSNLEKNCDWFFGASANGNAVGPNNLSTLKFNGTPTHSLVREAIQNSLDAVDDVTKPVIVSFNYRSFNGREFPNFFKLKDHIKGCLERYRDNDGLRKFGPMLDYFDKINKDNELGYLKVVDSNTVGMPYDKNKKGCPLDAFISEGVASKSDNNAGGSFGFGKAVFWMISQISTIFVSTKPKNDEKTYFVGLTKLCTHSVENGIDLLPNGIYSTNGNGEIICDANDIPELFVTKETGTSIFAIGVKPFMEEDNIELIKSVLRNFWMTIYKNKLIVNIENNEISKDTLPQLMELYFEDNPTSVGKEIKALDKANPRPYYELVKKAIEGVEGFKYIEEKILIESINQEWIVKLFLHQREEANGSIVYMRSPLMTVFIDKKSKWKKIEGVFICDCEEGNQYLREMEDCSHDSWTAENYFSRNNKNKSKATKVKNTIEAFIELHINQELNSGISEAEYVAGLEELLYIQNSVDLKDSKNDDEIIDPKSIISTPKTKDDKTKKKKESSNVKRQKKMSATQDSDGNLRSNSGGKNRNKKKIPGPIKPGNMTRNWREEEGGHTGIYAVPIDVLYRTWSQVDEEGTVWHIIRVKSEQQIDNAIISVFGIDADEKQKPLNIVEAPNCTIRQGCEYQDDSDENTHKNEPIYNAVSGVKLQANIAKIIRIRFESNIKYSLSINSEKIIYNEEE